MPKLHQRRQTLNNIFEISLYVICVICFIYFTFRGMYTKSFQAVLIIAVLLILRGIVKWVQLEFTPALRFSILLFITITMLLANMFNMYGVIPHLDKWEHLLSGVILCFAGLFVLRIILRKHGIKTISSPVAIWFAFFFAVAMAGVWEIYEFTIDNLFGLHSQNGNLTDTMIDIICGTVGALGAAIYLAYKARKHPLSF